MSDFIDLARILLKGRLKLFTLSTFLIAVILGIFGIATPIALTSLAKTPKMKNLNRIASLVGIISMVAFLCLLTLTETTIDMNSIQIHFTSSSNWFSKHFTSTLTHLDKADVIINSLMLVPLGVMSSQHSIAKGKRFSILKGVATGLAMSCFIECMQCILPIQRTSDFADIIFNTLGAFAGATTMTVYSKLEDLATQKAIQRTIKNYAQELEYQISLQNDLLKPYSKDHSKKNILTDNLEFIKNDITKLSTKECASKNVPSITLPDEKDDAHCKV